MSETVVSGLQVPDWRIDSSSNTTHKINGSNSSEIFGEDTVLLTMCLKRYGMLG